MEAEKLNVWDGVGTRGGGDQDMQVPLLQSQPWVSC